MPNELYLYGMIGDVSFFDDFGITDKEVQATLLSLPQSDGLDVMINSPGGAVGEGITIMNSIRSYTRKQLALNPDFKLRTIVQGFAYSIASVIMLAADERIMQPGSKAMVHNPMTMGFGNYLDFEKMAKQYKEHAVYSAQLYATATGKKPEDWQALMDEETFFTADEAVKVGLATKAEKFEPLNKMKEKQQDGISKLLIPSTVLEKQQETLDKISSLGKGAYSQAMLMLGRKTPTIPQNVPPKAEEENKNSSVKRVCPVDQLQLELDCAIM